jgi:hypothetical protein
MTKPGTLRRFDLALAIVVVGMLAVILWLRVSPASSQSGTATSSANSSEVAEASASSAASIGDYVVRIADGLDVNWTAPEAAAAMLAQIAGNERVLGESLAEPRILSV